MRPLLFTLVGVCASIGTSCVVWAAIDQSSAPYCEVLNGGLLRTTATENQVNVAVSEALTAVRIEGEDEVQRLMKCDYRELSDAWFSDADLFGQKRERASRLIRNQLDEKGRKLSVEVIRGAEMPVLVIVDHELPAKRAQVAMHIATRLAKAGVQVSK